MNWLVVALIAALCADIGTTWHLLTAYRKRIRENGIFGAVMFRGGFYGHLIFVIVRIALMAIVIQLMGWLAMAAWLAVTLFAVGNNLMVLRRLNGQV